jgi:hypothetical protein
MTNDVVVARLSSAGGSLMEAGSCREGEETEDRGGGGGSVRAVPRGGRTGGRARPVCGGRGPVHCVAAWSAREEGV